MSTPDIIRRLHERIESECCSQDIDWEARFDDLLDEIYDFKSVGGPFAHMTPSGVLKEVDPIAYRVGVSDYESSERSDNDQYVEIGSELYLRADCDEVKDDLVSDLQVERDELEDELDSLDTEAYAYDEARAYDIRQELERLASDLALLSNHSF